MFVPITTGDEKGIGLEVTAKALNDIGPVDGFCFAIFRGANTSQKYL